MPKAKRIAIFSKFRRLSRQDQLLLLQAIFWLAVAGLAIATLPFRRVGLLAASPVRRPAPPNGTAKITNIRWAIRAAAARVPWRALCFQQGLAAQLMLRRRGISSVLYYGAAPDEQGGLLAHVWVRCGDVDVIGGEMAPQFAVLATFPPQDKSLSVEQSPPALTS